MKKKKVMTALLLSAMMAGTLGTSVCAAPWTPNGTDELTNVSSSGTGSGIGTVTHSRTEKLFLVAVPTNYRKFQFYADPTGETVEASTGNKVEFANEAQRWQFPTNVKNTNATGGEVDQGRSLTSNYITAYNAGSSTVTLNVNAFVSLSDGWGRTVPNKVTVNGTEMAAIDIQVEGQVLQNRGYGAGEDHLSMAAADWKAGTHTKNTTLWSYTIEGSIPRITTDIDGADNKGKPWLERRTLWENGLKYTKDYAVSLEEYNQYAINTSITSGTSIPTREEFKYPSASFRLKGDVNGPEDPIWDTKGLTAHLGLKWYIKCDDSEEPWIDPVIVLEKGGKNEVEVNLGSGEFAMNAVTSVMWDVTDEEAPNGAGFKMELLNTQCTYTTGADHTGTLKFADDAVATLYNFASLNGSTMRVTLSNGTEQTALSFVLWVK